MRGVSTLSIHGHSSPYLRPGTWVRDYFEVMGCSLALDAHIYPCRFYLYGLELEIPKSWDAFKHWMLTITEV